MDQFLDRHGDTPEAAAIQRRWREAVSPRQRLLCLDQAIPLQERRLWESTPEPAALAIYQGLFRQREALLRELPGGDRRHEFVVVIPVADRPRHLRKCLDSLFDQCLLYQYGGHDGHRFNKVSVLIADDSRLDESIAEHRRLAERFSDRGLLTRYFGRDEQVRTLRRIPGDTRAAISRIIPAVEDGDMAHKGASITRNITCLKLAELSRELENPLFYFIDSDQEFKVSTDTVKNSGGLHSINYFHELDRIFTQTDACILTGKVVGDPPVSPAVMAGTFLNDAIAFFGHLSRQEPAGPCRYHADGAHRDDGAAYHDMAELFGFAPSDEPFAFQCGLEGPHAHIDTFNRFAELCGHFFDGGHPTRRTRFHYHGPLQATAAARTVYTGNYVIRPEGLRYFLPFAPLKLRMAGPVLGRLIQARIGDRFVSANLPMLHGRTVEETGRSEFRAGVRRENNRIDLSHEYERQYFGDVMLFSIARLTLDGFPGTPLSRKRIEEAVLETERELQGKYLANRRQTETKLRSLAALFRDTAQWWNHHPDARAGRERMESFIVNMRDNFGENSTGQRLIHDRDHVKARLHDIIEAIRHYPSDRKAWEALLEIRPDTHGATQKARQTPAPTGP
jgi:hypothetical protein